MTSKARSDITVTARASFKGLAHPPEASRCRSTVQNGVLRELLVTLTGDSQPGSRVQYRMAGKLLLQVMFGVERFRGLPIRLVWIVTDGSRTSHPRGSRM